MRRTARISIFVILWNLCGNIEPVNAAPFRAGVARVDISPREFPVRVNGNFLEAKATAVRDALEARALVLDDGSTRIALVVVDSCMVPRELLDRAKEHAKARTGIPTERMLISATHTHTAPAAMGALGCPADANYSRGLPEKIAEAIVHANENLREATIGWAKIEDPIHTHCRRWVRRPDKLVVDPFGSPTARAQMHPGYESPDVIGPSGPVDPELSILAVKTKAGRPLAVLANYSMHYFGTTPVSADYFGLFREELARLVGATPEDEFVAMMSQGTSGDQHWMDYSQPKSNITIETYAKEVAQKAHEAWQRVSYRDHVPLAMRESTLKLQRRVPDAARLAWAQTHKGAEDSAAKTLPEVYAREAFFLRDDPERELKIQAIRIGELAIAAIPNEVFALTGLKLKARSPFASTFTIELANGAEGYIPPPEQHFLGGYTTWPARTASLEVQAEPKIVEAVLKLLEDVSSKPRRVERVELSAYDNVILNAKPWAFWRLDEMEGSKVTDASGRTHEAELRGGFARYLFGASYPGLKPGKFPAAGFHAVSHAAHLAGGRLLSGDRLDAPSFTVELWFWNGLPTEARAVTAVLVDAGIAVGIAGQGDHRGRLFVASRPAGTLPVAFGEFDMTPATKVWHHLGVVVDGRVVSVYLNGRREIQTVLERAEKPGAIAIGGEGGTSLEGKIDEVAVFDRALTGKEIETHFLTIGP